MLRRVAEFITRYSMFAPGQTAGVAVSGGADSVCLLNILKELAPRWGLKLVVLHLDHQLRGEESRRDAEFVEQLARGFGLEYRLKRVNVGALRAATGDNLEQAARRARREFYAESIQSGLVSRIATGHTRSDQAETVLLRLLRGAGAAGLAGILPVTPDGLVRPLLGVGRAEVEAFLGERGIRWREDASNQDFRFARNRVRRQVLPTLARDFNPALEEALARTAALAGEDEAYWEREAARHAAEALVSRPPAVLIQAGSLAAMARPVARRVVRRAIEEVRGDLRRVEFEHVERIAALAEEKRGHGRVQLPGVEATRSFDWLRLAPPEKADGHARQYQIPLEVPSTMTLPGGGRLRAVVSDDGAVARGLDWESLPRPLEVRSWRPGDRYTPAGRSRPVSLRELFQTCRVPLWERAGWPVVAGGGVILWVRRFGPEARYLAAGGGRKTLKFEEIE